MWFMVALAGLAAASFSFAAGEDLEPEYETAGAADAGDSEASARPEAVAEDEVAEPVAEGEATGTDDTTSDAEETEVEGEDGVATDDASDVPEDPWMAGDPDQDLFVSSDEAVEEPAGETTEIADLDEEPAPEPPTADEVVASRDPWLDGVVDDEFLSTDDPSILV